MGDGLSEWGDGGRMEVGVGLVFIAHEGKSLHIAFGDIVAVMFEAFQGMG